MKVEGVVFDLDATLVDLGGFIDWRRAHERVVEAYLECGCSEEMVKRCGGHGLFDMLNLMWVELHSRHSQGEAKRVQGIVYSVLDAFEGDGVAQCRPMPGCIEALDWILGRGIRMGVATSNSQMVAERALELNGIRHYFTAIVGRSPKLRMKPYPDQIVSCFELLRVAPTRGVVVGDSVRDVRAAKAAGAYAIAVPAHFTSRRVLEESEPDRIIVCLSDLPQAISSL